MPGVAGCADDVGRAPQQLCYRHGRIGGKRHEGGVGAVFEKAPYQIGEEIAVAADRRVGAAGDRRTVRAQLRIQRFAHAVQALKLEAAFAV